MAKAIVTEIQVCGCEQATTLTEACKKYLEILQAGLDTGDFIPRFKINFSILLPDGRTQSITIRDDEEDETIVYGTLGDLPRFHPDIDDRISSLSVQYGEGTNNVAQ